MKGGMGKKLVLSFVGIALLGLVSGAFGYYGVAVGERAIQDIGDVRLPSVVSLLDIAREAENIRGNLLTLSIAGLDEETRGRQYAKIEEARTRYQAAWEKYESLPQTEKEAGLWKEFVPAWDAMQQANEQYLELNRQLDQNGVVDPERLGHQLEQFTEDHYVLAMKVMEMLFLGGAVFSGGEDATACNAGKWMAAYTTTNGDLLVNMAGARIKHAKFHEYIHTVKQLITEGKHDKAVTLYYDDIAPLMENTFVSFKLMINVANDSIALINQGRELLQVSRQRQDIALAQLDKIVHLNREIAAHVSRQAGQQIGFMKILTLVAVVSGMVLSVFFGIFSSRVITEPLRRIAAHLQTMAQGDFSVTVSGKDRGRNDEIGVLSQAAEALTASMCTILSNIHQGIGTLTASSSGLAVISDQMRANVSHISGRTMNAAAAAEESSVNSNTVAVGMAQATANLSMVAAATEQMSATISEIAGNAEQVRAISDEASQQAEALTAMMRQLGSAAQEIGKVTATITTISEQTNLLALNATIEAARAGEAGRGFAVVANEIKELSRQTSGATRDIRGRIEAIQTSTTTAMDDIDRIAGVITTVNEIVPRMAAAMEEQSAVTHDVARNIAQATAGVADSNEQVMQTARVATDIAMDMATINESVTGIRADSDQVRQSAAEMLTIGGQLKAMVADFKMREGTVIMEEREDSPDSFVSEKEAVKMNGFFDAAPAAA